MTQAQAPPRQSPLDVELPAVHTGGCWGSTGRGHCGRFPVQSQPRQLPAGPPAGAGNTVSLGPPSAELFRGRDAHGPLLALLDAHLGAARVQQVGWSLLCRLLEVCPSSTEGLTAPPDIGPDWEVLGAHQLVLKMLAVHGASADLCTVGLKALDLLLAASGRIALLILEEESDVFLLVLSAMRSFAARSEVQQLGCRALHVLLERVSEEQLAEFVENKDHEVLLEALRLFGGDVEVVLPALLCLHALAVPCSNVEVLMSGSVRCYNVVVTAMVEFPGHEGVQEVSCSLLHRLSLGNFLNILVLNKVHTFVVAAVGRFPGNAALQVAALSCLALLTETIFLNQDLEEKSEAPGATAAAEDERLFWLEACHRALAGHRKDKHVQEAACWALDSLLTHQRSLHRRIGDEDGQFPVHREVMLSMLMHSSCPGVCQAATSALSSLLQQNTNFRKVLLSKGIHLNVLELMQRHAGTAEVAASSCRLMNRLFQGSDASLDTVMAVVPKIIAVMRSHEAELPVQLEATQAILHFLDPGVPAESGGGPRQLDAAREQCWRSGLHKLVLAALSRFPGHPGLQRGGLRVLSTLALLPEAVEVLRLDGAVDTVLPNLQGHPHDAEIQHLGLSLIGHLATSTSLSTGKGPLLAAVLVSSLRRFEGLADVQIGGLRTALRTLELWAPFAGLLLRHNFDEVLSRRLSACAPELMDPQLLDLGCKCLARLAAEDEARGALLRRACERDDGVLAECLLLLGADINHAQAPGAPALICQVCEEARSPALVELLLRQGPREQDVRSALALSVSRGDGAAIGLLLRRLALDPAHGSACLGGLGLRRVEPAWLAPLFADPTPSPGGQSSVGAALARMVLGHQRSSPGAGAEAPRGEGSLAGDAQDRCEEWTLVTEFLVDGVFSQSDDPDSEGSEGSDPAGKLARSGSPGGSGHLLASPRPCYLPRPLRPALPQGPIGDQEDSREGRRSVLSPEDPPRPWGSLSPPPPETGRITSLDLSANELQDIDALAQRGGLSAHLEHLERLELHQNALSGLPAQLCQVLRRLTHLDLHSNKLTSFPAHVLSLSRLAFLDVSRNDIGPRVLLDPALSCPALRQLSLAHNRLSSVPEGLGAVASGLQQLALEGNEIAGTCPCLCLTELRALNLSKNHISDLAGGFLEACPRLESFSASMNLLATLPTLPPSLTSVKLAQNRFACVPDALLSLPHLRSLDMSSNEIQSLPGPAHWKSQNLRELLFSHNHIRVLDLGDKACAWARLEKLHLAHNRLRELPPEIGCLQNLASLDVSGNAELRSFPNEMGKLSKMWDLPLDDLRLDFDFKRVGCRAKDIIRFLQQRLRKAVPYSRLKLLVVGNAGSGKTTLLRQLMRARKAEAAAPGPTVGIDVRDWPVPVRGKGKRDLVLSVWDFAGREEFYSAHAHFMTPRALYLAVFDLSKGPAEVEAMKPWLFNIKARASASPVVLVGTHLDICEEGQLQACAASVAQELLGRRGFPAVRGCHFVNATQDSDALAKLRTAIIRESLGFKIRAEPVVGQLVPACYVELERLVLAERKSMPAEFPVVSRQRLLQLVREQQLQLDESELPQAVHFLSESGTLLHFQDPALQLDDLYFVDPKWLCKAVAQILTVRTEGYPKHPQGIVSRRDVEKFLTKRRRFPKKHLPQYFSLLEKFQLALPLGEDLLLVPSSLPGHTPVIELPHCENSEVTVRLYETPCFPMGFWPRLINRVLEISPYMLSGRERALRPNRMYWRQGVYLSWSSEAYCLVGAEAPDGRPESCLRITVPSCRKGRILLGQAVDHIDSLLEEWFPGLLETDVCGDGETLLKKWALYSFRDGEEPQRILLDDLAREAEQGDLLVSPDEPRLTVPIAQIAPDLMLADLPRSIVLRREALELQQAPELLLGDGSFGSVYRARYDGEEVAVKIFNKHTSLRLLRQELAVLCRLHHPSLVSLLAAGIRPRMLVMELAGRGSLDRLLEQGPAGLPRTLQHRIALHVADGLRYLHSAMIIYRDLKPHNVLLFTLHPSAAVIAKIADYGIAQYCCRMGIKTSEGTPGFRAPEVAKGNVVYNQRADVYSLGLLLYDVLTAGRRIAEGLKFPNEFDELAVQGKLPDPVREYGCAPWPLVEQLIKKCLKENPQDRPTSAQVFDSLTAAELVCLARHVPLPGDPQAECAAAWSLGGGRVGVWLGCGRASSGHLASLDLHTEALTSQEVADSQVLCLALVPLPADQDVWVVCGTQSGALLAVNAQDGERRHALGRMTDAVTCMCCKAFCGQRQSSFLLVGTADGTLVVFEDRAVKSPGAAPLQTVTLGDASTPLLCLSESANSAERNLVWGGCGTRVFSLGQDLSVQTLIETRTRQLFSYGAFGEANVTAVVGDMVLYVAKQSSPFVEVWDQKTRKLCQLVDCAHWLREEAAPGSKDCRPSATYVGRVKALCLQKNTALWVGTGGGCILLLDLSTHRLIRLIRGFYDSVRVMVTAQLGKSPGFLPGPSLFLKITCLLVFVFLHSRSFLYSDWFLPQVRPPRFFYHHSPPTVTLSLELIPPVF
ncbi:leucine-rich repeat serine/threonine-protein kinase 2 [Talpa occidentalis]|uniref:leucine-rich repeat serine/threonine-protein kinase 2 n=1 Tax=Talpa occidentalis TaxID=50954 RepID=UPI0023F94FCB|nr:leucine-rich repeat serine/threonine-protein kinase 2 [Talpa occidentalis]